MRRWVKAIAVVCAAAGLAAGGPGARTARAAAGNPIINDCQSHGQLTHTYTLAQLRHALAIMPASVKQYTNCYDVIQSALIQARKTGKAGPAPSGGSSSFLPTPVIVVLAVLIVAALGFAGLALGRRRRPRGPGGPAGPRGPAGPGGRAGPGADK